MYSATELKVIQEVAILVIFAIFAVTYLGQKVTMSQVVGFAFIALGSFFVFRGPVH